MTIRLKRAELFYEGQDSMTWVVSDDWCKTLTIYDNTSEPFILAELHGGETDYIPMKNARFIRYILLEPKP